MTPSRKTTKPTFNDQDERSDYSIYLPIDGLGRALPWKLDDYGDRGALSQADRLDLVRRFDLPALQVQTLSKNLGHCLDLGTQGNFVKVTRSVARHRAHKALDAAAHRARRAHHNFELIAADLAHLQQSFASEETKRSDLDELKQLVADVLPLSEAIEKRSTAIADTPEVAFDMSPVNSGNVADGRRRLVVFECCAVWEAAGRPITYTVPPNEVVTEGRLSGDLADFIYAVIDKVTKRSWNIGASKLRDEIVAYRDRAEDEVWEDLEIEDIDPSKKDKPEP